MRINTNFKAVEDVAREIELMVDRKLTSSAAA
jgi:hypothetical protein